MKYLSNSDFNSNQLDNVPNPVEPGDAVNKAYVDSRVGEYIYARDFGVIADGTTDDAPAMQLAFDYLRDNGGYLILPTGRIAINTRLVLSGATQPFTIRGMGAGATVIVRNHDSVGSVVAFSESDYFTVEDLSIIGNHATLPNGNHGLTLSKTNHVRIRRVYVTDWKNSAIILTTPGDGARARDVIFEDCVADGLSSSNNGFLISTASASGLINCKALNIGKTGSPCYALQLKNDCRQCFIRGGVATGASAGLALGQELGSTSVQRSVFSDVAVDGCDIGIIAGFARQNVFSNITINMGSSGGRAVDLISSNENSLSNLNIQSVVSGTDVIRYHNSDYNTVEVGYFRNNNAVATMSRCVNSSDYNLTRVSNISSVPGGNYAGMLSQDGTSANNKLLFDRLL